MFLLEKITFKLLEELKCTCIRWMGYLSIRLNRNSKTDQTKSNDNMCAIDENRISCSILYIYILAYCLRCFGICCTTVLQNRIHFFLDRYFCMKITVVLHSAHYLQYFCTLLTMAVIGFYYCINFLKPFFTFDRACCYRKAMLCRCRR